jgi:hypothetical protein
MTGGQSREWWRPDALVPAVIVVGPYFLNKLVFMIDLR